MVTWQFFKSAVKEVNHIRCFAIDIAKYLILLSCRLAMEHLCVLDVYLSFLFVCTVSLTLVSDPTSRRWLSCLGVAIRRRKCPTIQQKNEWTQKWPYKKDALARESTLCVAGALVGWLCQIQNLYHWPKW
jgi:hypothetical protein